MDSKSFAKGITATLIVVAFVGIAIAWSDGQTMGQAELNSKDVSTEYLDCNPVGSPYINEQEQMLIQEVYCMDIEQKEGQFNIVKKYKKYAYSLDQLHECLNQSDTRTCAQLVKNSWINDNAKFKEEIKSKATEWQKQEQIQINPSDFALTNQELN